MAIEKLEVTSPEIGAPYYVQIGPGRWAEFSCEADVHEFAAARMRREALENIWEAWKHHKFDAADEGMKVKAATILGAKFALVEASVPEGG